MSGADSVLLPVLDLCGDLLADVDAHVRELVLRGGAKDEQKLLECARECASRVSTLVAKLEDVPGAPRLVEGPLELLAAETRALRDCVLELFSCARRLLENSQVLDSLAEAHVRVVTCIHSVDQGLKLVRFMVHPEPAGALRALTDEVAFAALEVLNVVVSLESDDGDLESGATDAAAWASMVKCVACLRTLDEQAGRILAMTRLKVAVKDLLQYARAYVIAAERTLELLNPIRTAVDVVAALVRDLAAHIQRMETFRLAIASAAAAMRSESPSDASPGITSRVNRAAKQVIGTVSLSSMSSLMAWNALSEEARTVVHDRVVEVLGKLLDTCPSPSLALPSPPQKVGRAVGVPPLALKPLGSNDIISGSQNDSSRGLSDSSRGRARTQTMKELEARKKMHLFSSVSTLSEWQVLTGGEDGSIQMGGLVGEVTVHKSSVSASELTKLAIAFIISSNAHVLTKKTTRQAVEEAAVAFLGETAKVLAALRERADVLGAPPQFVQLAVQAIQACNSQDLKSLQADPHIVADASQQTFGSLLRQLYSHSNHIRVMVLHLLMVIQRGDALSHLTDEDLSSATPLGLMLQGSALGLAIVELLRELHVLVVTARHISSLTTAPEKKERGGAVIGDPSATLWDEILAAKARAASQHAVSREGFLTKQGHKRKNWKRRWFALKDGHLSYFSVAPSPGGAYAEPKKKLFLGGASVSMVEGGAFPWQFSLSIAAGQDVYPIYADSEKERAEWISDLERAIAGSMGTGGVLSSSSSSTMVSVGGNSVAGIKPVSVSPAATLAGRSSLDRTSTPPKASLVDKNHSKGQSTSLFKKSFQEAKAVPVRVINPTEEMLSLTGLPRRGSLNRLVEAITHASTYDHSYMVAFIGTYRSFTNPELLLKCLLKRFDVPESAFISADEVKEIHLRVPVVLKYWMEVQSEDLDDSQIAKLLDFAKSSVLRVHAEASAMLVKEIEKQIHARKNRRAIFETPPIDFAIPTSSTVFTPCELVLTMHSPEVARQLTLIDHALFCNIHPTELLNQSWAKSSRKHHSPHVVALVTRLNRIAMWVPAVILWQDSEELRSKAVCKFIEIATELRSLNNFHTLMGIIAGLNSASCSKTRLKNAWAVVPQQLLSAFAALESLMSPKSSWKAYRAALRASKLPCLPYLGCYLGDLTFVDEGNPDELDGMINFEKYLEIWRYICEVQGYKREKFTFPHTEPLYTLLLAQPGFSDKELYDISLVRERRAGTVSTDDADAPRSPRSKSATTIPSARRK